MTDQAIRGETVGETPVAIELLLAMSPRATFRRLRLCGLSAEEAGNLTARLEGLRPVNDGWTVREIERLVDLRWLVERGQFAEDERAADLQGWPTDAPASA
jgi:hypothetical protein